MNFLKEVKTYPKKEGVSVDHYVVVVDMSLETLEDMADDNYHMHYHDNIALMQVIMASLPFDLLEK